MLRKRASTASIIMVVDHADEGHEVHAWGSESPRKYHRAPELKAVTMCQWTATQVRDGGQIEEIEFEFWILCPDGAEERPAPPPTSSMRRCEPKIICGQHLL